MAKNYAPVKNFMKINMAAAVLATMISFHQACVTASGPKENPDLKISDSPGPEKPKIQPSRTASGLAPWSNGGKAQKVAWFLCAAPAGKQTVLLAHDEASGFNADSFCNTPESQAFISSGFHVLGINRPGFAPSTGEADLVGKASQQAALVAAKHAAAQAPGLPGPLTGAFGFGTGAAAASFFAKQHGNLSWLIVGSGIYDFEQASRTSSDKTLIQLIEKTVKKDGDTAHEIRSIGYDVAGLPARIAIFQGASDTVSPADQAYAFRDSLAASEYKVTFQMISGIGHEIPPAQMRQIMDVTISSVATK
ncbi:MAG: Prolyl oligopeptidase family [Pseudomonadota bacterium]|jgi:predicted esterase